MKPAILIGAICCAALAFVGGYFWRAARPGQAGVGANSWNMAAIGSEFTGIRVRELDPNHAAVDFVYDLNNRGGSDLQLTPGPGTVVMKRLQADGSLSPDANARLVSRAFVPANNRTQITVETSATYDWPIENDAAADQAFRNFVAREVSGLQGFVIFDQASRFEIELPIHLAGSGPLDPPAEKTNE